MSLALLFHHLMLNMFRKLIHPSSGACDLFVELFHGLYCSGAMCVGVTLWFGWGGVVSVRVSVVGIATDYGLDGPAIESRWRRDFPHMSRPAQRPTQTPIQWVPGLSRGVKSGQGVTLTPHPF